MSPEEKDAMIANQKMEAVLQKKQADENKIIKLLLLGTGESGKSTIFKQMQILYGQEGFSENEKNTFRYVLRRNVVESMQTLLMGCQKFDVKFQNPNSDFAAKFIMNVDPLSAAFWVDEIAGHITELWTKEPAIKTVFEMRSKMQLIDSAPYLFDNMERIGKPDYTPNQKDILYARLRTSGIVEKSYRINNVDFKFLDVGGQRNERRKWIHCFEGVTAVMFVAAISEYDQMLYEDEKENRVHEAVNVFKNISNSKYFIQSSMILFLNKKDLFEDKIKTVPLTVCFPEYKGDQTFDACSEYMRDQFLSVIEDKKRQVYPHITCATDTDNVQRVFTDCKSTILQQNLERLQLVA
jgi:guanine nucleotide-binding protein G(i) subunit alpha